MSPTVALSVRLSTSQKTGVAPTRHTADAAATKLIDGITTASPGPQPRTSAATNRPSDAHVVATIEPGGAPWNTANRASNSATRAPRPTQLDENTSSTALSSRVPNDGWKRWITTSILINPAGPRLE